MGDKNLACGGWNRRDPAHPISSGLDIHWSLPDRDRSGLLWLLMRGLVPAPRWLRGKFNEQLYGRDHVFKRDWRDRNVRDLRGTTDLIHRISRNCGVQGTGSADRCLRWQRLNRPERTE